jgi:ERCC4-type nuclease
MEQREPIRRRIVDTAEPFDAIQQPLIETGWERQRLYSGDFMFFAHDYRKVGVTRKRVNDLLSSIGERFSKQLEEMLDYYQVCILLLEGSWRRINPNNHISSVGRERYVDWNMAWNYVHRWMSKGFILELTTSEKHTVHRLNVLYALYQKPSSMSAKTRLFADDRVLALPSGTRGATGLKVLQHFGSLQAVANATVEQLRSVDGVGDKKANLIYQHFTRGTG